MFMSPNGSTGVYTYAKVLTCIHRSFSLIPLKLYIVLHFITWMQNLRGNTGNSSYTLTNLSILTKAYFSIWMQRMSQCKCYSVHSDGFLYIPFFFFPLFNELAFPSCSITCPGSIFLFQYSALSVYNLRTLSQLLICFLKNTFILSHDFIIIFVPFPFLGSSTLWKWWMLSY